MADFKRVQKELVAYGGSSEVFVKPKDKSLMHLIGTILGPIGTPYEGGVFDIDINLHGGYPFRPPKMQFITKVWHPNISSQNGYMCLENLENEWTAGLNLRTALLSVQALLSAPQPDDPLDVVVANQYLTDHQTFEATARQWTATYAVAQSNLGIFSDEVQKLTELEFPQDMDQENQGSEKSVGLGS